MVRWMSAQSPAIEAFGGSSVLERDPIEVARAVLLAAEKHGAIEFYVDANARPYAREAGIRYADELPALWLVGVYTKDAGAVRIMEDLQMRLAEVRAAHG